MERLSQAAEKLLQQTIIPFWAGLRDRERGGFYGWVGQDLTVDKAAEKGCILNSRILWFFSEAAMTLQQGQLWDLASHAYDFLVERCLDRENDGLYWSVSADGQPLDTSKHTYNQAFGLYALSAYSRLTGDGAARGLAKRIFRLIEERCRDQVGYLEAFARDWRTVPNEKLSENGVLASRTMNTLLHVFEGYAGYYKATRDPEAAQAMGRILTLYTDQIYDPARCRQRVFMDDEYRELIDLTSFGHDIESSWLIDWGCGLLADPALARSVGDINSELARAVYDRAYRDHSLITEQEGNRVDTTRVWWVQAEGVLGFLNQWAKHPEETRFRDGAADIFRYIRRVFVDPRPGSEWFWAVDETGVPIPGRPIAEPWKCPYHNGRMCLEIIRRDPDVQV